MDAKQFGKHLAVGLLLLLMTRVVLSAPDPVPPVNVSVGASGSYIGASSGFAISAIAGNVTAITISHTQSSQFWQGYYGNITGEIVLDDTSNNTLFSWVLANPSGEIYASNTSSGINWGNVTCVNLTNATGDGHGSSKINRTSIQSAYNMTDQHAENLSATFNTTFSGSLTVSTVTITAADQCPQLYTYIDNAWQQNSFKEVLLFDNESALLFTAILQENTNGFQSGSGDAVDFQMMVLEDGTPGGPDTSVTTYYFYVELN